MPSIGTKPTPSKIFSPRARTPGVSLNNQQHYVLLDTHFVQTETRLEINNLITLKVPRRMR